MSDTVTYRVVTVTYPSAGRSRTAYSLYEPGDATIHEIMLNSLSVSCVMVTGLKLVYNRVDATQHDIIAHSRVWMKGAGNQLLESVCVSWGCLPTDSLNVRKHPNIKLVEITSDVAAMNLRNCADLEMQWQALKDELKPSTLFTHGLVKKPGMQMLLDPWRPGMFSKPVSPSLHAGARQLNNVTGSAKLLLEVFTYACAFAEKCLGPSVPTDDGRAQVCLALSTLRGMYQTERAGEDDRAFSFGIQQDCDDMVLQVGGFLIAFVTILSVSEEWEEAEADEDNVMTDTTRLVMRVICQCTAAYAHAMATPPQEGSKACGHVILMLFDGAPAINFNTAWCVEPTWPCIPADTRKTPQLEETLRQGICRLSAPERDYGLVFFVLFPKGPIIYLTHKTPDGVSHDGADFCTVTASVPGPGPPGYTAHRMERPKPELSEEGKIVWVAADLRTGLDADEAQILAKIIITNAERDATPPAPFALGHGDGGRAGGHAPLTDPPTGGTFAKFGATQGAFFNGNGPLSPFIAYFPWEGPEDYRSGTMAVKGGQ